MLPKHEFMEPRNNLIADFARGGIVTNEPSNIYPTKKEYDPTSGRFFDLPLEEIESKSPQPSTKEKTEKKKKNQRPKPQTVDKNYSVICD